MRTLLCLITILTMFAIVVGCQGGKEPVTPGGQDDNPPQWERVVGIIDATTGDGTITVTWSKAVDEISQPVKYLVYLDTDDNPWDKDPIVSDTTDPYTFTGLANDIQYWAGVRCRDSANPPNVDNNIFTVSVMPKGSYWVRTWGGEHTDEPSGIASDANGNIFVAGLYSGTVDFDPGTNIVEKKSFGAHHGTVDAFIVKYSKNGVFDWVITWGGVFYDPARGIVVNSGGDIYVCGYYSGWVDFDPGPGIEGHQSYFDYNYNDEGYLSKFDNDGNFQWVKTWSVGEGELPKSMELDSIGNIVIAGHFALLKFDSSGNALSKISWGYPYADQDEIFSVAVDQSNNMYVYGVFQEDMDMDPTGGQDIVTISSENYTDIFVIKLLSDGSYGWSRTWGGEDLDYACDITTDSAGNTYTAGAFNGETDFNPGPGTFILTANNGGDIHNDSYDAFLSKMDSDGDFIWAKSWGSTSNDTANSVIIDSAGNCVVAGNVWCYTDMNPGDGVDFITDCNGWNHYLSKFDSVGNYKSFQSCGGIHASEFSWPYKMDLLESGSGYYYLMSVYDNGEGYLADVDLRLGPEVEKFSTPENYGEDIFISKTSF